MQSGYWKIRQFLGACDGLVEGKYAQADGAVREVLRAISESRELTQLFGAVTEGFDYPSAKRSCLRFPAVRGASHGAAFLPAERGEVLAFVFCLLVEFDAGTMKLNDFLLRYFYEDGSYTASYALFAARMIRPFRDIVKDCFPELERKGENGRTEETLAAVAALASSERARVRFSDARLSSSAQLLLSQLSAAEKKDAQEVKALLEGYRYFVLYARAESEESEKLLALAEQL